MNLRFWAQLAVVLTALAMGGAWLMTGAWGPAAGVGLLAALWIWGQWRRSHKLNNALFAAFLAVAAMGVIREVMPGAMLAGSLAALAAWDLGALTHRLDRAGHVMAEDRLQGRHIERLLVVLSLGGILGGVALAGRLSLSLGGAIGLGLVAALGLRWLFRATARNSS